MEQIKYKEYESFFTWLFDKPIYLLYETDLTLKGKNNPKEEAIIYYPLELKKIINTPAMLRMSKIFQLGTKIYRFPRVHHTRLEHCKGTYFRSLNTIMTLCKDSAWKEVFEKNDNKKWLIAKITNDLLHDIGHGPFSHTMESVCELPKGFHEDIGRRLIMEDKELSKALNEVYPNLGELIIKFQEKNPLGLASTSEGQIDVDRGDFMPRDDYFLKYFSEYNLIDDINNIFSNYTMKLITTKDKSKAVRPVYNKNNLTDILNFLESRFYNYRDIYYNINFQKYDYVMKAFVERLLKSEEEYALKDFFLNNFRAKPEDIDLTEYIKWTDVKLLKGITEVIKNTEDKTLKTLGLICIPNEESMESLIEGAYISKEQSIENMTKEDFQTIRELREISKIVSTKYPNIVSNNIILLNSTKKENVEECRNKIDSTLNILQSEEESNGIISWSDNVESYNNKKGEEIYLEDAKGNIEELAELTSKNIYAKNILNLKENINGLLVLRPILEEKDKDSIQKVKKIINEFNKETNIEELDRNE